MVIHFNENKVQKNFEDNKNEIEHMSLKDFKLLRIINHIFFGNEIQGQLPIPCNFDFFKSIQFNKGCYLGQETSARQYFTGNFLLII